MQERIKEAMQVFEVLNGENVTHLSLFKAENYWGIILRTNKKYSASVNCYSDHVNTSTYDASGVSILDARYGYKDIDTIVDLVKQTCDITSGK